MKLTYLLECGAAGTTTVYVPLPSKGMLLNGSVVGSADPGAASTVSILSGATEVAAATITDVAAGTVTALTMDTADGKTAFDATTPMQIAIAVTGATTVGLQLEFDEFARTTD